MTLVMIAPITIRPKAIQPQRGAARRQRSKVEEQKYRIAISKKMIQKISMSMPWAVSVR